MKKHFKIYFLMLSLLAVITSCVKNEIDEPPTGGSDPIVSGTKITIDSLKNYFTGSNKQINDDVYIEAIVNADDRSGNIYKELIVQDATGGMAFQIDESNFYTDFPVGRKVFVKLKGLWIADNSGVLNVGGYIDLSGALGRIPLALIPNFILKGSYYHPVPVDTIDITMASDALINKLVCFKKVEFVDYNNTYADAINQQDENRDIQDCNGNVILMRNSGYANFAGEKLPRLNGNLTAVLQKYNSDFQLKIRDTKDVAFVNLRCDGSGGVATPTTIANIRSMFTGSTTTVQGAFTIKGIVTSDKDNLNLDTKNIVIQDATGGIVVRFTGVHTFAMGDEVEIEVSGQELSEYHAWLQINKVANAAAVKTGTGTITPVVKTIQEIVTEQNALESTLVKVSNATLSGFPTYSGNNVITDGTNNTILYTRFSATFAASPIPTTPKTFTVIVSDYDGLQLQIRNLNDVQ